MFSRSMGRESLSSPMSSSDSDIRVAAPDDARSVADLQVRTWRTAYRGHVPDRVLEGLEREERAHEWESYLERPDTYLWIAEREEPMGFIAVGPARGERFEQGTQEIYAMYVLPDHWRRGWGRRLFEVAREELDSTDTGSILWALRSNERARAFYESVGFEATGTFTHETMGEAEIELELYRRDPDTS